MYPGRTLTLASLTICALAAGRADAQSYASAYLTPSSAAASLTFDAADPWQYEVGASLTYQGQSRLFGSVIYSESIPVAETFPLRVTPFYGASLSATVATSGRPSLGGSAYLGATFPISQDLAWYVQSGPFIQLYPQQEIIWGGSTEIGVNYYFGR